MATQTESKWVRRRIKAARLLGICPVLVNECNETLIAGFVGGDSGEYLVHVYADGTFACNCEWGHYHSKQRDPCSHALALAQFWDRNPYLATEPGCHEPPGRAEPVASTEPAQAEPTAEPPLCPVHNVRMKRSKYGGWYCPVKIADDDGTGKPVYCKQRVK